MTSVDTRFLDDRTIHSKTLKLVLKYLADCGTGTTD
jgi:hypothetical protein